jgi:hypothetical protein
MLNTRGRYSRGPYRSESHTYFSSSPPSPSENDIFTLPQYADIYLYFFVLILPLLQSLGENELQ